MPQMVCLGRRWRMASDSLGIPAMFAAGVRFIWASIVLGFYLGLQYLLTSCRHPAVISTFIGLSVAVGLAILVVEVCVIVASSRGSIVDTDARKDVGRLVFVHFALGAVEVAVAVFGLSIVTDPAGEVWCDNLRTQYRVDLIVALVAISELVDVIMRTCCCALLAGGRAPSPTERGLPSFDPTHLHHDLERWEGRCRTMCTCLQYSTCFCFSSGGEMNDLETVARLLADVFQSEGMIDITASDVLAGIILLRHVQKAQEHELVARLGLDSSGGTINRPEGSQRSDDDEESGRRSGPSSLLGHAGPQAGNISVDAASTALARGGDAVRTRRGPGRRVKLQSGHYIARNVLQPDSPDHRPIIEEGAYFMDYALAIYTWMLYVFMDPLLGFPKLGMRRVANMKPTRTEKGAMRSVYGDNCFRGHEAAILNFLQERQCEVVYVDLVNSIYDRPYAIVIDHKWQCVVVTIRGTLSLEDLIIDGTADAVPLDELGRAWGFPGEGQYAHGGILNSAECVVKDLMRHRIVHTLLQQGRTGVSPPPTPATPLTTNTKGYSLRVVGHSLGAAAAQLASLMLRRDFPDLRCLCYGPPGATMSPALAEYCKPFTLSFIIGRDLVPRLSIPGITRLRDEVLNLIARCRVSKVEVFRSVLRSELRQDSRALVERMLYPPDQVPQSALLEQIRAWEARVQQQERHMQYPVLQPGGHLIYLVKSHQELDGCCGKTKQCYTPTFVQPDDLQEICVATSMASDHLPNNYLHVLHQVAEEDFGIDLRETGPQPVHSGRGDSRV